MARGAIFRYQIIKTWSTVGNRKISQSLEDEKQSGGIQDVGGYLNKALGNSRFVKNRKKKETPGPHGCKPEGRLKKVK